MARKKSPLKAKEPVRLRFKTLSNGNKSIYLDMYRNGQREYEFLHLYIVPESTPIDKMQNARTIEAANAIKSQRILELTNEEAGLKQTSKGKMLLSDWMQRYHNLQHTRSKSMQLRILKTAELLQQYAGNKVRLKDVDKEFCTGFADWLQNDYLPQRGNITPKRIRNKQTADRMQPKRIKAVTAHNYFVILTCALNEAVRQGIIEKNPCQLMNQTDKIKVPESQRTYLTIDEVRKLIKTDSPSPETKQAFLFSCFCGLRISDILRLQWKNVVIDGEQARIVLVMKKTKAPLYLPLSKQALNYIPLRSGASDSDKVFSLPSQVCMNRALKKWAAKAGITNKNVSFHTARHTFATTLLTEGADLYTVSKLLGHSEISTTQIYAKIIDKKKDEAVNLLDNLF